MPREASLIKALDELAKRMSKKDYPEIEKELKELSSDDLIAMLNAKSLKVINVAAEFLHCRGDAAKLIRALVNGEIRAATGRGAATNVLNWFGKSVPDSTRAMIHCIDDRSDGVVSNALFGIVFMGRRDLLPLLQAHLGKTKAASRRRKMFLDAIDALNTGNPSHYSPGFFDAKNVWQLRPSV